MIKFQESVKKNLQYMKEQLKDYSMFKLTKKKEKRYILNKS